MNKLLHQLPNSNTLESTAPATSMHRLRHIGDVIKASNHGNSWVASGVQSQQRTGLVTPIEWSKYYFIANDVGHGDKKRSILLSACGASTFKFFFKHGRERQHHVVRRDKTVKSHCDPVPSVTIKDTSAVRVPQLKRDSTTLKMVKHWHAVRQACMWCDGQGQYKQAPKREEIIVR